MSDTYKRLGLPEFKCFSQGLIGSLLHCYGLMPELNEMRVPPCNELEESIIASHKEGLSEEQQLDYKLFCDHLEALKEWYDMRGLSMFTGFLSTKENMLYSKITDSWYAAVLQDIQDKTPDLQQRM